MAWVWVTHVPMVIVGVGDFVANPLATHTQEKSSGDSWEQTACSTNILS